MKKVSIIVSPKQNEIGEILKSKKLFKDDNGNVIHEQNILQCFVHACSNENGKLNPVFIPKEEHFIFKSSNKHVIDQLDLDLNIEFTMVSHLSITLNKDDVADMIENEIWEEKDIAKYLRNLFPYSHVNYKHLTQIKNYLSKCKTNMENAYDTYYVYSLLNRIGFQINIEYDNSEVLSSDIVGPVLITGYDSNKWKPIQWGGKRIKREPFNGIPIIVDEVWKPAVNNH